MAIVGTRTINLSFSVSGWVSQRIEVPENLTNGELEKMLEGGSALTSISGGAFEIYNNPHTFHADFSSDVDEIKSEIEFSDYEVEDD